MFVFVIMPFEEKLSDIYKNVVKVTLEAEGCTVQRADEFINHQGILKDIVSGIFKADLIIADLTNPNPNVYYELGIAHGLNKPTILLTQNIDNLPFDLASYRAIPYSENYNHIEKLRKTLQLTVQGHKEQNIEFGNPVSDYRQKLITVSDRTNNSSVKSVILPKSLKEYDEELAKIFSELLDISFRLTSLIKTLGNDFEILTNQVKIGTSSKNNTLLERATIRTKETLDHYALEAEKELPHLREKWEMAKANLIAYFTLIIANNEQEIQVLQTFKSQLEQLNNSLEFSLSQLHVLSLAVEGLRKANSAYQQNTEKVQMVLDEQYEIFFIGSAYIVRAINLIARKLS